MNCIQFKKKISERPSRGQNTHTHPHRRLAHLRLPSPPPHVLDLMRTERTHFYPQHWLLCHMGLYKFKFKFLKLKELGSEVRE